VQGSADSVSSVSGTWTVPTVTGSGTSYSSVWVGIDGYQSSTVEQIGTESDVSNGKATYYAWYEMYPSNSVTISSITVKAGDSISAAVTYGTNSAGAGGFTLTLTDGSQTSTTFQAMANAQRSSAEWIVEAPSSNSVLPLANFGTVAFSNVQMNGAAVTSSQAIAMDMASSGGVLEDTTSSLTSAGFSVTYDSSGGSSGSSGYGGYGGGYGFNGSDLAARDQLFGSKFDFVRG
jgi:hypothetical protein